MTLQVTGPRECGSLRGRWGGGRVRGGGRDRVRVRGGAADHNEGAFAVALLDWLDLVDLIYWAK